MSGTDPTVRRTGAGGSGEGDCPGEPFVTVLGSPDPAAVAELAVDDLLDIASVDEPARGIVALTTDGLYVGAVVKDILRLRRCIAGGNVYEADVLAVAGGSVTVQVRPA